MWVNKTKQTKCLLPVAPEPRGKQVALFYSYELKLTTVFQQFSSNLNLEFLSETLPRFPNSYEYLILVIFWLTCRTQISSFGKTDSVHFGHLK
jgi:hypothetical protein